jgi:hypothetical protein
MGYVKPMCNEVAAADIMIAWRTFDQDLRTQDDLAGSLLRVQFVPCSTPHLIAIESPDTCGKVSRIHSLSS